MAININIAILNKTIINPICYANYPTKLHKKQHTVPIRIMCCWPLLTLYHYCPDEMLMHTLISEFCKLCHNFTLFPEHAALFFAPDKR